MSDIVCMREWIECNAIRFCLFFRNKNKMGKRNGAKEDESLVLQKAFENEIESMNENK